MTKKSKEWSYGFVYLWRDKTYNRFYIGSHWGFEDDGYVCSSNAMREAYRRRKHDFKRRILQRVYTDRKDLLETEQTWINKIKPEEFGRRYYNVNSKVGKYAWWMNEDTKAEVGRNIRSAWTPEVRAKQSVIMKDKTTEKWKDPDFRTKHCGENHHRATKGKKNPKISLALTGKKRGPQSKEHKRKMVETRKKNGSYVAWNKGTKGTYKTGKRPMVQCPVCNKLCPNNVIRRYHYDNCKEFTTS